MSRKSDSNRPRARRIDRDARVTFVTALRQGATRADAARQAGFTYPAFYNARRRDPLFKVAWIWALEACAAEERARRRTSSLNAAIDGIELSPNNKRLLQPRRVRFVRFTPARKQLFLDHFAGTADVVASAEAAGVHISTVYKHRRLDPEFATGWDEALAHAYAELEAEAVRQRLEAQRNLRDGIIPKGEMPKEFDRVIRLLSRYERKDGRIGIRERGPGREARWSFDDAIALLDRKLRALGVRYDVIVPEDTPLLPGPKEE